MLSKEDKYHELSYYTLSHSSPDFIHQHIVDAFAAQQANEETKPIKLAFALIGLYLHLEKGYSGKQVQQAHMQLGKEHKSWPEFSLPDYRGDIAVDDVLAAEPGEQRDAMIHAWCQAVWKAYAGSHVKVRVLAQKELLSFD
ncbi:MAG: DUF5946 family protein [Anaerolineales bacterium]